MPNLHFSGLGTLTHIRDRRLQMDRKEGKPRCLGKPEVSHGTTGNDVTYFSIRSMELVNFRRVRIIRFRMFPRIPSTAMATVTLA